MKPTLGGSPPAWGPETGQGRVRWHRPGGKERGRGGRGSPLGCPAPQPGSPAAPRRSRSQTWRPPPLRSTARRCSQKDARPADQQAALALDAPTPPPRRPGPAPRTTTGSSHARDAPETGLPAALPEAPRTAGPVPTRVPGGGERGRGRGLALGTASTQHRKPLARAARGQRGRGWGESLARRDNEIRHRRKQPPKGLRDT